jgi:hypothetical protein
MLMIVAALAADNVGGELRRRDVRPVPVQTSSRKKGGVHDRSAWKLRRKRWQTLGS